MSSLARHLALAVTSCALACGSSTAPEASQAGLQAQLDAAIDDLDLVGGAMTLAFAADGSVWSAAGGLARVETNEAWEPGRLVRIGSTTKTFTAALIFLLQEQGALSLDDPLELWVPGYYDGAGITLRHLLSNTSGIVSYNYVGSFDESRPWTPEELLEWAVVHEPQLRFEPGAQWEYSNTNFVLLGMVVEAASGLSYEQAVASWLTQPLGLDETYIAASGDTNAGLVDCYDRQGNNLTHSADPSFGWAAGAGVSTPEELSAWLLALYGGELLSDASLTQMLTPTRLSDGSSTEYGLGAFVELDGEDALYGHSGGIAGYLTYMFYWRSDDIALVATTNTFETELRNYAGYGWSVALGFVHP